MNHIALSLEATSAMQQLLAGKVCLAPETVIQELGRAGLACRFDLRKRSRRIVLTTAGHSYLPPNYETFGITKKQ